MQLPFHFVEVTGRFAQPMAERSYDEKWRTMKVELASLYKQEKWTKDRKLDDIKIMLSHTERAETERRGYDNGLLLP